LETTPSCNREVVFASPFRVIFAKTGKNHPFRRRSGDQALLLRDLNGLGPAPGIELVEQPAGVRLHRILAHEELFRDLAGAQTGRDVREDFVFARRNAKLLEPGLIDDERRRLANDDDFSRGAPRRR
jgi:hypothetical protein